MSMKNKKGLLLGAVLVCATIVFVFSRQTFETKLPAQAFENVAQSGSNFSKETPPKAAEPKQQAGSQLQEAKNQESSESEKIILTEDNFEEFVTKCFQGKPCEFGEDPWALYQKFKRSQHPKVCDSIIAMMRRNLSDPAFKEKYKDVLLAMIRDYYPAREIDFQTAAYYDYLGDRQKSLELYLALERKQATDPELRHAPKLNIANVYYNLGKLKEARPYYQSALQELMTSPEKTSDQRSVIQFIQGRIQEIDKTAAGG